MQEPEDTAVSKIYRHLERQDELMIVRVDGDLTVVNYSGVIERPALEEPSVWHQIFPALPVSDDYH